MIEDMKGHVQKVMVRRNNDCKDNRNQRKAELVRWKEVGDEKDEGQSKIC